MAAALLNTGVIVVTENDLAVTKPDATTVVEYDSIAAVNALGLSMTTAADDTARLTSALVVQSGANVTASVAGLSAPTFLDRIDFLIPSLLLLPNSSPCT
jgi:hypothetical protein